MGRGKGRGRGKEGVGESTYQALSPLPSSLIYTFSLSLSSIFSVYSFTHLHFTLIRPYLPLLSPPITLTSYPSLSYRSSSSSPFACLYQGSLWLIFRLHCALSSAFLSRSRHQRLFISLHSRTSSLAFLFFSFLLSSPSASFPCSSPASLLCPDRHHFAFSLSVPQPSFLRCSSMFFVTVSVLVFAADDEDHNLFSASTFASISCFPGSAR